MTSRIDPIALTRELIRCRSITPQEGGALDCLQKTLSALGFRCERLVFSAPGTPDVDNLFARYGEGEPHLCFAGHTDVVPVGDESLWAHPPFAGEITGGAVHGRGASDMKGAIACFVAAAAENIATMRGSLSLLITGDEEGPSINGTDKVLAWMRDNNHIPTQCIVGEPTSPSRVGEIIKVGRRGFVSGKLTIRGKAGHTAYGHLANNPIPGLAKIVGAFSALELDKGSQFFEASRLEFTTVDVGNRADNVIPAAATGTFNIRFNDLHSRDSLRAKLDRLAEETLAGSGLTHELSMERGAEAFITTPGREIELFDAAVRDITGLTPELSTSGGTSDARFIRHYCPVFEFGLVNRTIHQTDEHAAIADIEALTAIYTRFIRDYFAS